MAEETKKTTPPPPPEVLAPEEEVVHDHVVSDVPVAAEKPATTVVEKAETPAADEREKEKGNEAAACEGDNKVAESTSFKEESNKVDDLIDPEKKALDELKLLIQDALNNHHFTAPPPSPEKKEEEDEPKLAEEIKEQEPKTQDKKLEEEAKTEETKEEAPNTEEKTESCEEAPAAEVVTEDTEKKVEEKAPASETAVAVADEETSEAAEEIKETIVHEVTAAAAPPPPPEEVSIWGVPLLADERSDVILLKFLRARDFKVKEAFAMLKSVVAWRKEFKIDELLLLGDQDQDQAGLDRVVYMQGADKEGHPVCYNALGEFQDKELYTSTFSDAEKRAKFLSWYILFLEKNIRKLDFSPEGTCTIVQVIDLKNSPGLMLFKKELRQATNQALQLLQDNYPEFVAKQVFINVPWWYVAYNRMISPFLTQRTKSKFVFAGPTRTAETLFKYIAPEQVPVQYGGLSKDGEQEFTTADVVIEETVKPTCKHTIEFPISEAGTLVWEVRVVGWDVSYGAEFVPSEEGGYTWIVQKSRKIGPADEQVLACSFKIGEPGKIVLTFDNQTSKKKKLLYRAKTKPSE